MTAAVWNEDERSSADHILLLTDFDGAFSGDDIDELIDPVVYVLGDVFAHLQQPDGLQRLAGEDSTLSSAHGR